MPEKSWDPKDERQYEHVKESERERGRSPERSKEIVARTVNKRRRKEGRAASGPSRATGNPNTPLEDRLVVELRNIARSLSIKGRSRMRNGGSRRSDPEGPLTRAFSVLSVRRLGSP